MRKIVVKKLSLNRESIGLLESRIERAVGGGDSYTCEQTCVTSCLGVATVCYGTCSCFRNCMTN
jgi:hypothetical protein